MIEAQNNMNHLLMKTKKRESSEIEDTSLMWSTLMLQQRYFNLNLFLIDMECILERRLEVLEKVSNMVIRNSITILLNLSHNLSLK